MVKMVSAIIVVSVIAILVLGFILGYIPWPTQHSTIRMLQLKTHLRFR